MSDEAVDKRRLAEIACKFGELARIEAIIAEATASLRKKISAVAKGLNKQFCGDEFREGVSLSDWLICFRLSPILKLVFESGYQPSSKRTLARCEIRSVPDDSVVAVLHLVRVNDHGEWEHVPTQALARQAPFSDDLLLGLLDAYASAELRRYSRDS